MTAISWLDEQILALDRIVERVVEPPRPKARSEFWICQTVYGYEHPYRITNGSQDLGHYATLENAQRALAEMTA